jgi:hypothetical protein
MTFLFSKAGFAVAQRVFKFFDVTLPLFVWPQSLHGERVPQLGCECNRGKLGEISLKPRCEEFGDLAIQLGR